MVGGEGKAFVARAEEVILRMVSPFADSVTYYHYYNNNHKNNSDNNSGIVIIMIITKPSRVIAFLSLTKKNGFHDETKFPLATPGNFDYHKHYLLLYC